MTDSNRIVVRVRGIILNENNLLVVKHEEKHDYYALPGGHLEWGETPEECLQREIREELGITARIGKLLYINTFTEKEIHSLELFYEIANPGDFSSEKKNATHEHEVSEIRWVSAADDVRILPGAVQVDLVSGVLGKNTDPLSIRP
jgi:8-oxo-dGTP diphosphatase